MACEDISGQALKRLMSRGRKAASSQGSTTTALSAVSNSPYWPFIGGFLNKAARSAFPPLSSQPSLAGASQ